MPVGHAGSWFGLPDFGVTEKIGQVFNKPQTSQGGSNVFGPQQAAYQPPQQQVQGIQYQQPTTSSASTGRTGGGVPSTSQPIQNNQQAYQNVNSQQQAGNSQIDQDYEIAMGALNSQEQGLRGAAETATGTIANEAAATKTSLGAEQATKEGSAMASQQTAEKQGKSAMQQARDVFRQTQQGNIAQLSAMGISSSSVSEALAERLGVETARRIAGVTGSIDEVRQNTTNELGRIKNYYSEKQTQVQDWVANEKSKINNQLLAGLSQINTARQTAAADKAKGRQELLSQVQNQVFQLQQQEQQFQQSLQQWAEQKAAALTPIVQDPNYVQNLIAQTQNLNQQFQATGFVATPSFNVNQQGQYTGQINMQKKPEDELAMPAF